MAHLKEHAKFALSVLAVIALTSFVQSKFPIPIVGPYLPGGQ